MSDLSFKGFVLFNWFCMDSNRHANEITLKIVTILTKNINAKAKVLHVQKLVHKKASNQYI